VDQSKGFEITKQEILTAYKKVKANKGSAGCDGITIEEFDKDMKNNLYKIWNRMSSGCYFPKPVKLVEIPKLDGTKRPLGIPAVSDRIAQQVVKARLEPHIDNVFHEDSFGYRPNKSAHDAIAKARQRCWKFNWCIDLDIKGFFENINHELLLKAVRKHTTCKWIVLYIERWLTAPVQLQDGSLNPRAKGTPQGGVISPLLANLYLHYVFDKWVQKHFPKILFERYADDIVIHCRT
jgi:RNA-directed DNA polymerase